MKKDFDFLQLAVEQAELSVKKGGFPAGSVVVKDGQIISQGISIGFQLNDPTSHAETASMREACQKLGTTDLGRATLYASLEPCLMCFSVANWSGIGRIVYGCKKSEEMVKKQYYEGSNKNEMINKLNNRRIELVFMPDFEDKMQNLITTWELKLSQGNN